MNEKIAEIALRAGYSSWELSPSKETASDSTEKLELFAKLIAHECIIIVSSTPLPGGKTGGTAGDFTIEELKMISNRFSMIGNINEHFGLNR